MIKPIQFFLVLVLSLNVTASVYNVPSKCFIKAEVLLSSFVEGLGLYDEDGIEAYVCNLASNKVVIVCELSATKGDGAAVDTYKLVMDKKCSKAYRYELVGEE